MSTKHLILGLAAAALVGSAIGVGHLFAGDDALQVNAAEVGEKLPTIAYDASYYEEKLPYVVTSETDNIDTNAELGDIRINWISDYTTRYNAEGADLAYRITIFDAGTTQVIGEAPTYDASDIIGQFDFDDAAFIDHKDSVAQAIAKATIEEGKTFSPDHYLGFAGQLVDLGGVYEDGDTITFLNSYKYDRDDLFGAPYLLDIEGQGSYYVHDDGSLNHTYFSNIPNNWMEPYLELQFGFFSVGADPITEIPVFDPETNEILVMASKTDDGFLSNNDILDAFLRAGIYESNDYYGVVVRLAPRDGTTNNPFVPSDWVVLKGSHQYNVPTPKQDIPGLLIRDKTIYSSYTDDTAALNDGIYSVAWFANSLQSPSYILIDLGATYDLTQFGIEWEGAYATDYDIYFGNAVVNEEDPFADGFLDSWKNSQVLSYDVDSELVPATTDQLFTYYPLDTLGETVSARYILISLNVARNDDWGYKIFEIAGEGTLSEHSYAYYAMKEYLTGLGCEDFKTDSNKAKEVNATLTHLYSQLSADDIQALATEEIDGNISYDERAIYLIERSAYYSATTSNGAKLIGGDSSSFAPIIATVALLGAAGGAALLLAKSRKRSK